MIAAAAPDAALDHWDTARFRQRYNTRSRHVIRCRTRAADAALPVGIRPLVPLPRHPEPAHLACTLRKNGRGDRIRTYDLRYPKAAPDIDFKGISGKPPLHDPPRIKGLWPDCKPKFPVAMLPVDHGQENPLFSFLVFSSQIAGVSRIGQAQPDDFNGLPVNFSCKPQHIVFHILTHTCGVGLWGRIVGSDCGVAGSFSHHDHMISDP